MIGGIYVKKVLMIVNPFAGKNQARSGLLDVIQIFNRARYAVTVMTTQYRGHATILAQRAKNWDMIVCLGGDGTLNEVISGVLKSNNGIPIGYIPAGSTNDFANSLGLSKDPIKAAKDIILGRPNAVDVGQFGDRYFTYVASFGAFTKASYATPQQVKRALGHAAYVLEGVKELPDIRSQTLRISSPDGDFEGDYIWGAVANTTSVGGMITLDSDLVKLDDGRFELILIKNPETVSDFNRCVLSVLSQDYDCDMVDFVSTSALTVTADPQMDWTLDGERENGRKKIEIRNIKQAVSLVANR